MCDRVNGLFWKLAHKCLPALRSPDSNGHLFIPLFSFQFAFFLGSMLGRFLMFPLPFIFTSLVTHFCSSVLENDLHRTVRPKTLLRLLRLAPEIVVRHSSTPPTFRGLHRRTPSPSSAAFETDWHSVLALSRLMPSRSPFFACPVELPGIRHNNDYMGPHKTPGRARSSIRPRRGGMPFSTQYVGHPPFRGLPTTKVGMLCGSA